MAGRQRPSPSGRFRAREAVLAREGQEGWLTSLRRAPGAVESTSVIVPAVRPSMHVCISCSESPHSLLGEPAPDTLSLVAPGGDRAAEAGSPRPAFSWRHLLSPRSHRPAVPGAPSPSRGGPWPHGPAGRRHSLLLPSLRGPRGGTVSRERVLATYVVGRAVWPGEIRQPVSCASHPTHVLILRSAGFRCAYPSTSASGRIAFVFLRLLTDPPADLWPSLQLLRSAVWKWSWGLRGLRGTAAPAAEEGSLFPHPLQGAGLPGPDRGYPCSPVGFVTTGHHQAPQAR